MHKRNPKYWNLNRKVVIFNKTLNIWFQCGFRCSKYDADKCFMLDIWKSTEICMLLNCLKYDFDQRFQFSLQICIPFLLNLLLKFLLLFETQRCVNNFTQFNFFLQMLKVRIRGKLCQFKYVVRKKKKRESSTMAAIEHNTESSNKKTTTTIIETHFDTFFDGWRKFRNFGEMLSSFDTKYLVDC